MKLVIDAHELFSALIAAGRDRQTKKLEILFLGRVELFAPSLLFRELSRNSPEIKLKSRFSDIDFEEFVKTVKSRILLVPVEKFSDKLFEAKEMSPHPKDIPYFALALKLNCPLWSGEKRHKEQSGVKVFNTKDLVEEFGL